MDNRERLRSDAQAFGHASFYIENIIARRKRSAIISIPVRSNSPNFFFFAPAQNDWRIVSIVFHCHRRRVFISELDRSARKNLQTSFEETWGGALIDVVPTRTKKMQEPIKYLRDRTLPDGKKVGRDRFSPIPPYANCTYGSVN